MLNTKVGKLILKILGCATWVVFSSPAVRLLPLTSCSHFFQYSQHLVARPCVPVTHGCPPFSLPVIQAIWKKQTSPRPALKFQETCLFHHSHGHKRLTILQDSAESHISITFEKKTPKKHTRIDTERSMAGGQAEWERQWQVQLCF